MSRIPLVSHGDVLTHEQREVYDRIVSGPRGVVVGPLRAALHSPELADRWQALGEFLRYKSVLVPRIRELAIILVGRFWNSELEWKIHADTANREGIPDAIIEAIRTGSPPRFADRRDSLVYEYTRELLENGVVSDAVYQEAHTAFETVGVVELTALIGYYAMVCMTLNAHHITLPPTGEKPTRPALSDGLPAPRTTTRLPPLIDG